ncbi:MAG TPA: YfhO family protein [Gemmatimonadaceae bacterium]|nr:YfhO family protein [Gemmatimonadaceae bacterium]
MTEMEDNKGSAPTDFDMSGGSGSAVLDEESPSATSGQLSPPATPRITREMVGAAGPRRGGLWAALLYAVCTLGLGYAALAGQFLAGPNSDQYVAGYAFRQFGASVLKATHGFPQWNPYIFGGMPYVAAMHGDIFYPTFLLRLLMPTDVAMTWSFMLHLFLAGLFAYHFVRSSGFGFYPALFAGVAYMMSGQLASLVSPGHDGKLYVSALFPLTLWLLTLTVRDGRRWAWGALALVIGLAVLSPHPQLLQYVLLASAAFTIHLGISAIRRGDLTKRDVAIRFGLALGSVALGSLMGAIQYLPVREYVAWSPRAGGLSNYATAVSYAWPLKELFDAYLPQFTGMIDGYWGENAIHLHSDYLGATALLLAGAAFSRLSRDPRKGFLLFWAGTLVIALLWALGGDTPFYHIPYAIIPGTKYFRAPATVFFVGMMGISVLAAAGVERVLTRELSYRYVFAWLFTAVLIAGLATKGILTDFAQALASDDMLDAVNANAGQVVFGAWRSLGFVALAVVAIAVYKKGRLSMSVAGWVLACIAAVDSWTIMKHYWIFSPPASITYKSDAAIDRVRADTQPSRVLAMELQDVPFRDTNLEADGLMIHNVRGVLGYHGNQLGRFNDLLDKEQGFQEVINPRIWQLYNVRYLLTNVPDVKQYFPGAQWLIGPVNDAAGADVYLYSLPGENPYSWVTPAIVKAEDESVKTTLMHPSFDVRAAALFASDAPVEGPATLQIMPVPLTLRSTVTHYEPGRVSISLSSPAPAGSALLVSENYYPGWHATVDGKPAALGRADYTLTGVQLPEGARKVELWFDNDTYERGKIITLIAILASTILIFVGAAQERKRIA